MTATAPRMNADTEQLALELAWRREKGTDPTDAERELAAKVGESDWLADRLAAVLATGRRTGCAQCPLNARAIEDPDLRLPWVDGL